MLTTELVLRKGADRRLRGGHNWVYSNEVDSQRSPLGQFADGEPVRVIASGGAPLGVALMEPRSLICARLYSRTEENPPGVELLERRLRAALNLRETCFDEPFYRLAYGDSDGLPGIVIDRFGDYLVVQCNTAGAETLVEPVLEALRRLLSPAGVLLRCDSRSRRDQGLPDRVEVVLGEVPELVTLRENGVAFQVPLREGQKTGWFYDHRANRAYLQSLCRGARVLDVYSYLGGWGIQALAAGAESADLVDSSAAALAHAEKNAELNALGDRLATHCQRADQAMQAFAAADRQFDIVVLDPPAFIRRKRDINKGRKAYRRINELAMSLLTPGGTLVSASCSMHLSDADLVEVLRSAGQRRGQQVQIFASGSQGPDHPVHAAIPETRYLKAVFARVSPVD